MVTQRNRLNETVSFDRPKLHVKTDGLENIHNFMLKNVVYLDLCMYATDMSYIMMSFGYGDMLLYLRM